MRLDRTALHALLQEEGLEHDDGLLHTLERFAALGSAPAPEPSGPLALLLEASAARAEGVAHPRWITRRRGAIIGVLVAAGMGLGATGVAAVTGQAWPWQARDWSDISLSPSIPTQAPATGHTPSTVDPASPAGPTRPQDKPSPSPDPSPEGQDRQDGNAQGEDTQGQTTSNQTAQGQNSQGENSQGENSQGGPSAGSGHSGRGSTGQGSSSQGGNSQGSNR